MIGKIMRTKKNAILLSRLLNFSAAVVLKGCSLPSHTLMVHGINPAIAIIRNS